MERGRRTDGSPLRLSEVGAKGLAGGLVASELHREVVAQVPAIQREGADLGKD